MPARPQKKRAAKLAATPLDLPGYIIAAGSVELRVQRLGAAKSEIVKVHLIRAAAYPEFLTHLQGNQLLKVPPSDERLAELVAAKPKGWADGLHPLSVQEIKGKALELNFTAAQAWVDNQLTLQEANDQLAQKHPEAAAKALETAQSADSPISSGSTT